MELRDNQLFTLRQTSGTMDTQTASGSATIVESLDYEGRGVAHFDGKAVFIAGALPYELVQYLPSRKKN